MENYYLGLFFVNFITIINVRYEYFGTLLEHIQRNFYARRQLYKLICPSVLHDSYSSLSTPLNTCLNCTLTYHQNSCCPSSPRTTHCFPAVSARGNVSTPQLKSWGCADSHCQRQCCPGATPALTNCFPGASSHQTDCCPGGASRWICCFHAANHQRCRYCHA